MTREELEALIDRAWFGPTFTLSIVDEATVKVKVDVRPLWPGGPRDLVATVHLEAEWTHGQVVLAILAAAGSALTHELEEQVTIDGKRWRPPHPVPLLTVSITPTPTTDADAAA